MIKKNKINFSVVSLIIVLMVIVTLIVGGTLAWLQWSTSDNQKTTVEFAANRAFECSADGGGNITSSDVELVPSFCTNSEHAIQREIKVMPTLNQNNINLSMDLWLDINNIGTGLSNSENFRYVVTTTANDCTQGVVNYGTFTGKTEGDKIQLLDGKMYSESMTDTYYLYVWLDVDESSVATMNQSFNLSLNGNCTSMEKGEPFYAVYSADDTSLRFYKEDDDIITDGSTYNNLTATNVYKAYENDVYTYDSETTRTTSPWDEVRENVTKIVIEDEILPHSTANWFTRFTNTSNIDVTNLNTSNTEDMQRMFDETGKNTNEFTITGLNNWDVSNVTDMSGMFQNAGYSATTWNIGNLSNWNTENVIEMRFMFNEAGYTTTSWNIGDLSGWDTSSVANMRTIFQYAGYNSSIFNLGNIGSWDVSNVTSMYAMFNWTGTNATEWNIGDLSNWNTFNTTNVGIMFKNAAMHALSFNIGNIGNWNVSNVRNMNSMFQENGVNATEWYIGDLSNWDVSHVTTMATMFYYAGAKDTTWSIGDLSNWNVSKVTSMEKMFCHSGQSTTIFDIGNLGNWNVSNVTKMNNMFSHTGYRATMYNIGNLSNWDVSNVTNMSDMFLNAGYSDSTWSLDLSKWNVGKVTSYTDFNTGSATKVTAPIWVNEDQGTTE